MARMGERLWRLVHNKLDGIVDMARHGDSKLYTVHLSGKVACWKFECCYLAGEPRGMLYLLKRVYKHKQGGNSDDRDSLGGNSYIFQYKMEKNRQQYR
uniref:Uncharacterized protein n=1 Tax=Oryza barthii TaxID=65489 RepID=A0A0D3FTG5_9ORYZ